MMSIPTVPKPFIGREPELHQLQALHKHKRAVIAVIKGRRRIGKSQLALEFAKGQRLLSFSGLAPVKAMNAQMQRDAFARQLAQQLQQPLMSFMDWSDAFNMLSYHLDDQPTVILFDEISWLAAKDPTFIPKLKVWWDLDLSMRSKVILIFCGSVSTWIEKNILNSTAFFGRITLILNLLPLNLAESHTLLRRLGFKGSAYEVFKLLAVMGGVPWYLEQVLPDEMADQAIKRLCFEKDALLLTEFDRIFHDLFNKRADIYKEILELLVSGSKTLSILREELNYAPSGTLSLLIKHLITSGFVQSYEQYSLKTGALLKQTLYRIDDPYIRFYLKYMAPNLRKIEHGFYQDLVLNQLPGFDSMMSLQVESLLLQNRSQVLKAMGVSPMDVVFDNPYQQKSTDKQTGCQIDYLVQTRTQNVWICEFKFRRNPLELSIIEEVQEKIKRLSLPRGFAAVPVLFHLSGVSEAVEEANYFYRLIDISNFLVTSK